MRIRRMLAILSLCLLPGVDLAGTSASASELSSATILIPGGSYVMGSNQKSPHPDAEKPEHTVYLDPFLMDMYEVTNEMFARFLNASMTDKTFEEKRKAWVVIRNDLSTEQRADWWPTEIIYEGGRYRPVAGFEKYPVISVSWHAADAFCRWAGKRLPSEAEWEKAARGGLEGKEYTWGDELPTDGIIFKRTWSNNFLPAPVEKTGNYYPNGYGLYDMAGNVSEWCSDWYDWKYYRNSPGKNPKGPDSGRSKVVRGGSWAGNSSTLRVAFRSYNYPANTNSGIGFRCAADVKDR